MAISMQAALAMPPSNPMRTAARSACCPFWMNAMGRNCGTPMITDQSRSFRGECAEEVAAGGVRRVELIGEVELHWRV